MKKIFLMAIFSMLSFEASASETNVNCQIKLNNTCKEWQDRGSCGNNCEYEYNNGTLRVKATGENASVNEGMFFWGYYSNNEIPVNIENIEIDGDFDTISKHAFTRTYATVSSTSGTLKLKTVGWNPFGGHDNLDNGCTLVGNIVLDDDLNASEAFLFDTLIDGNLIISENAHFPTSMPKMNNMKLSENGKIFCKGDVAKCKDNLAVSGINQNIVNAVQSYPMGCEMLTTGGICSKCENGYEISFGKCRCAENFKQIETWCNRIRYT
ncbi:MAG: hypothetical protein IKO06_06240, partial [Alphaproteobacteria bacterium]|nr:hypothetical protein [Alphaproteobacteria bacterium]